MSLTTDQKALLFIGAVAVLGAGVRITRWQSGHRTVADGQPALERQLGAVDSAAHAARRPKSKERRSRSRGGPGGGGRGGEGPRTSNRTHSVAGVDDSVIARLPLSRRRAGPGYIVEKLNLDAATAEQIESLPGIGPALARRIVTDRAEHGPFVTLQGFGRVKGVGPALLRRLDTLVTFSATLRPLSATPESVSARPTGRRRPKR